MILVAIFVLHCVVALTLLLNASSRANAKSVGVKPLFAFQLPMAPSMGRPISRTPPLDQLTRVKLFCGIFSQNSRSMSSMVFRTSMADTCMGLALKSTSSVGINSAFAEHLTGAKPTKCFVWIIFEGLAVVA